MSLESPRLDDRDFESLLAEARRRAIQTCPEWTDHSPSEPGTVLLELFAFLTDIMIYRLNRLPEKAYVEFLKLIGVKLRPPGAAAATLVFSRKQAGPATVEIPRGTRVSTQGGGGAGAVFITSRPVTIEAGEAKAEVLAHHCELVQGELVGEGIGRPGLTVRVRRPPIVAPTGDELDLVVGVEVSPDEVDERIPALRHEDITYRIWREVDHFTDLGEDRYAYVVDRVTGTISFAPAIRPVSERGSLSDRPVALAEAPPAGRRILVWYRRGGGAEGNVGAATLTALKDPIPGVDEVSNPDPATGGRPVEPLENALLRGPQELHSLERAISARDFELLALRSSGAVARAKAVALAELWAHARPGTVEILLVPDVPEESRVEGRVLTSLLAERETDAVRGRIANALEPRQVLGTRVVVSWARYKVVAVKARVVVYSQEDPVAVEERVLRRLHRNLSPLPTGSPTRSDRYVGWPFGRTLRESDVYDVILAEPGVSYVDSVRLLVQDAPDDEVPSLAVDRFQPRTWYAACRDTLFRSLNRGAGWEPAGRFEGQSVTRLVVHPDVAGLLAAVTLTEGGGFAVHVSRDCGESWEVAAQLAFEVEGLTWVLQEGAPVLLLATDKGLYSLAATAGASPVQVSVDPRDPDLGIYAVTATTHVDGSVNVAVALQETRGVYLSIEGGRGGTFRDIGLKGQDVRSLAIQSDGPRRFLWAGIAAAGDEDGRGCFSWELRGSEDPPEGWQSHAREWKGGTCHDLAFRGSTIVAASHKQGVVLLASRGPEATWAPSDVRSGLPLRDPGRFHPVRAVDVDPDGRTIMAGTPDGVFRSREDGGVYVSVSSREFDRVTLPPTWLFCPGDHEITVVTEDAARGD